MSHVKKVTTSIISHYYRNKTRARHLCSSDWFSHQNSKSDWKWWWWWWWWRPREGSIQKGNGSKDSLSECWQREERWKGGGGVNFLVSAHQWCHHRHQHHHSSQFFVTQPNINWLAQRPSRKYLGFPLWCSSQFFIALAQTRTKVADTKTICHNGTGLCHSLQVLLIVLIKKVFFPLLSVLGIWLQH